MDNTFTVVDSSNVPRSVRARLFIVIADYVARSSVCARTTQQATMTFEMNVC